MKELCRKKGLTCCFLCFVVYAVLAALGTGILVVSPLDSLQILLYRMLGWFACNTLVSGILGDVIWYLRLPRFLMALLVGSGLALSGAVMQAVIRNPLADPYLLGISSGAGLGATVAIALGIGQILGQDSVGIFAFSGAVLAAVLILLVASIGKKADSLKILLVGLGMNIIFSAWISLVVAVAADQEGIQSITYWLMGSLLLADWGGIGYVAVIVITATAFFMTQTSILNMMLLGDDVSLTLGRDLTVYRKIYIVASAVLTGVIVYHVGIIGFVGLVIPHIVRMFTGNDYRLLLPGSVLLGGCFMVWADVLSRTVSSGTEIPIGIVASVLGAPIFLYLLMKKKYGFGR